MTSFDLTPMTEADLPAVLSLLEQSELPTVGVRENVLGFLVARSNGDVVASAAVDAGKYFERFGFVVCPRDEAPVAIRESWEFRTGCPDSAAFMRYRVKDRHTH